MRLAAVDPRQADALGAGTSLAPQFIKVKTLLVSLYVGCRQGALLVSSFRRKFHGLMWEDAKVAWRWISVSGGSRMGVGIHRRS